MPTHDNDPIQDTKHARESIPARQSVRPTGDVSRLTITLRYHADTDDGKPWAWSTEYGHGMAASPNEAAAIAHSQRASVLSATAADSRRVADEYDGKAEDHHRVALALTGTLD